MFQAPAQALMASIALTLALSSHASFANMSVSNAEVLRAAGGPKAATCTVYAIDQEDHEVTLFSGDLDLSQNQATLETAVGAYSVLMETYASVSKDDGSESNRLEIQINGPTQQEDYINSSVKPIVFLSSVKGEVKDQSGANVEFTGILIDCSPKN